MSTLLLLSLATASPPSETGSSRTELAFTEARYEVVLGETAQVALTNPGKTKWVLHHPGGSNGCAGFDWGLTVIAKGERLSPYYPPGPGRACTMALVPPRDVVVAPGEVVPLPVSTRGVLYGAPQATRGSVGFGAREIPWSAGTYRLELAPGVVAELVVTAAKR